MPPAGIAEAVVAWQRAHGRQGLPWQGSRDPYRVWLSEIMLQQTQVGTVLGYYDRFLARFPDVQSLAAADLDEVLALWSGLGYYSRARNLHRCAQAVVQQHRGCFPADAQQLAALPGIGPSTAAAIAAFCFHQRVSILDGNVKRVLARLLAFDEDLATAPAVRRLWALAEALLPADAADMPAYTQGLMDLGATVCGVRTPACPACPLHQACRARQQGSVARYPVKSRRLARGRREHWWLWLAWRDQVWLQQRPPTGVWAGLWTLPMFDDAEALHQQVRSLGASAQPLPTVQHALTHFDWTLHPWRVTLEALPPAGLYAGPPGRWVALQRLPELALPAPLTRLLTAAPPVPL